MDLDTFIKNWSSKNIEIIYEINNYFTENNNTEEEEELNLLIRIKRILIDIFDILTKENRGYYSGTTFIILSLIIYYMVLVGK